MVLMSDYSNTTTQSHYQKNFPQKLDTAEEYRQKLNARRIAAGKRPIITGEKRRQAYKTAYRRGVVTAANGEL